MFRYSLAIVSIILQSGNTFTKLDTLNIIYNNLEKLCLYAEIELESLLIVGYEIKEDLISQLYWMSPEIRNIGQLFDPGM